MVDLDYIQEAEEVPEKLWFGRRVGHWSHV
jgi:hypothetical protein